MTTNGTEKRPLPDGWHEVTLEDIAIVERGITFPSSVKQNEPFDGSIVCLRTTNVQDSVDWDDLLHVPRTYVKKDEKLLRQGDILISMANSRELVGKVSFVDRVKIKSSFGGFIAAIRAYPEILPRFLFYQLRTKEIRSFLQRNSSQTVNIANLSLQRLYPTPIYIAPIEEQERIVAEIEKQFTRLDQAVASLRRLQSNLARYKASVLKAACEGRLVPQDPADEPAGQLLARILAERRAQWEAQEWQNQIERAQKKVAQARRKANGRSARISDLEPEEWKDIPEVEYARYLPKNDKWKKKYKEPEGVETAELPELPNGWVWARFDQLLTELKNGYFSKAPDSEPPGIPILRISAVRRMSVDLDEPRYLREEMTPKVENYLLEENDLLFTRYNGNLHYVGVCGVVRRLPDPTIYPDKLIRARVPTSFVSPSYLEIYFASPYARRYIESKAKSTAGQHGIAGGQMSDSPVKLPPLAEQERIVAEVERRLSVVTAIEQTITANLSRAERLRQSILHRAFTGQL